jgi:teichuronic acid biosynthesis glycosyltransferase TuaG
MESPFSGQLCSIILPVYNSEPFIRETVLSVLGQTYANFELIVVDDASTDASAAIVEDLAGRDSRLIFLRNGSNLGCAQTRNRGLDQAKGEYLAFIDSDDVWMPEKLGRQLALLEGTGAALVYSAYDMLDVRSGARWRKEVPERTSFAGLLKENYIAFPCVCCRRACIENNRFSDEFFHEDYVFLLHLLIAGITFLGINEPLALCRRRPDSRTGNKRKSALHRWKIYRGYLKFGLARSVFYFLHYVANGLWKYGGKHFTAG